jgi:DNA-binding YbaB/EbfC family protein
MSDQGGLDLNALLQQAQAIQEQMAAAQEEQANSKVTGTAGGKKVMIEMTGDGQFLSVAIEPDVVDPDDVQLLEELVLAALRDGASKVMEIQQGAVGDMDLGGIDLGGLGGLLGGE